MSTRNNPGDYDFYASADPDEEVFPLLGRDRHASALVALWALIREKEGEDAAKVAEARGCAERLAAEATRRGKPVLTLDALLKMAASMVAEVAPTPEPGAAMDLTAHEGDVVISGRGPPARLVRVFGKDDPEQVRGYANLMFPQRNTVNTVRYDTLRRALPEEVAAYRKAGGE